MKLLWKIANMKKELFNETKGLRLRREYKKSFPNSHLLVLSQQGQGKQ